MKLCYAQGLDCTWRTLNGVKFNNNWGLAIFGSVTMALSRNYTKRKVFRLCLFSEIFRFYARTLSKMIKS